MAKSIIQSEKKCFICGSPYVEEHHIFFGTANRRLSESRGLKCWLCNYHHTGSNYRGLSCSILSNRRSVEFAVLERLAVAAIEVLQYRCLGNLARPRRKEHLLHPL